LIDHAFSKRQKELDALWPEFAEEVYQDVYPPDIQKKMSALPEGFLKKSKSIHVQFGGRDGIAGVTMKNERRCASKYFDSWGVSVAKIYDEKHPLTLRYKALTLVGKTIKDEIEKASQNARAVMNSVSTVNKLMTVWPECEKFIKPHLQLSTSTALAIPMVELNKTLGLPPDTSVKRK